MAASSPPADVDAYITTAPSAAQPALRELRRLYLEAAPDAEERISYGMPSYRLGRKRLGYFSVHARHVGLYPADRDEAAACGLEAHFASKSTLQFALDAPLPSDAIRMLLQRRVARLREGDG